MPHLADATIVVPELSDEAIDRLAEIFVDAICGDAWNWAEVEEDTTPQPKSKVCDTIASRRLARRPA